MTQRRPQGFGALPPTAPPSRPHAVSPPSGTHVPFATVSGAIPVAAPPPAPSAPPIAHAPHAHAQAPHPYVPPPPAPAIIPVHEPPPPRPSMIDIPRPSFASRLRKLIPLAVIAAAGAGYGAYRYHLARLPYEWSGTVEAREIKAGSRVGGRVHEVLVQEGDHVKANQPLVVLEKGDLDAQRLMAQAALDQANAQLEKLAKGSRRGEIVAAFAHSSGAQTSLRKAQQDVQRSRSLFAQGAISKTELEAAEAQYRAAQASATEAAADAQVIAEGSRSEDIKAAHALVDAAKGRLDQINVMIDELTISSPLDARIVTMELRPGDILAPNATAVTLLEEKELHLRVYVPETQLGYAHVGQEVPIYVDSFPKRAFKGVIESIGSVGEYSPRNLQTADERANQVFATRVRVTEGADDLRSGMAAFIRVPK